jgi:hypothetical protein
MDILPTRATALLTGVVSAHGEKRGEPSFVSKPEITTFPDEM